MDEIPQKQGASQDLCMFWSVSFADWGAKKTKEKANVDLKIRQVLYYKQSGLK